MKQKTVSKLLAVALVTTMFLSACGAKENEKPVSEESKTSVAEKESASDEKEEEKPYWELLDEVSDTSELPDWTGETLDINVWYACGNYSGAIGEIPEDDVVFKEIERVTGIKFNAEDSFDNNGELYDAIMPRILATGDYPNIIINWSNPTFLEAGPEGLFADLTKYYEDGTLDQMLKYIPLEEGEAYIYKNMKAADGKYYAIPCGGENAMFDVYNAMGNNPDIYNSEVYGSLSKRIYNYAEIDSYQTIWVREDILQALMPDTLTVDEIIEIAKSGTPFTKEQVFDTGLESPEDFFQFCRDLKAVIEKEGFVDDAGKEVEVTYGWHTEENWSRIYTQWVRNIYGAPSGTSTGYVLDYTPADEDHVIVDAILDNGPYLDYMKQLNKLVREDVISQDSFVDNMAVWQEKVYSGHYALIHGGMIIPSLTDLINYNYRPVWVDSGFNVAEAGTGKNVNYTRSFSIMKDTLTEEQLDQLMHAINYMNSKVGILNMYYGPASAGLFEVDADGNRTFVDPEIAACYLGTADTGAATKYGLQDTSDSVLKAYGSGYTMPYGVGSVIYDPATTLGTNREINLDTATLKFSPGVVPGYQKGLYVAYISEQVSSGSPTAQSIEAIVDASKATGGEDYMNKMLVAEDDEAFNEAYEEWIKYNESIGFDEAARQAYNDLYVEKYRDELVKAGILK